MPKPMIEIVDVCNFPEMVPLVAQWHHQEWAHLNPGQSLSDRIEKMAAYLDQSAPCAKTQDEFPSSSRFVPKLFVAFNAEARPIGTAALDLQDMDDQPMLSPWLASVYVVPEMRRQGIASTLIAHAVNFAASKMGVEQLYLFTPNQRAFYEGLGWSHLQHLSYYGEDVDLMCYKFSINVQ